MHLYPGMVAACTYGALAPDLDSYRSIATRMLGPAGKPLCSMLRSISTVAGLPEHRGITHQPVAQFVVSAVVAIPCGLYGLWWVAPFLLLGMLTHDLGDLPTVAGLCVTWPVKIKGRRDYVAHLLPPRMRFRVGSQVWRDGKLFAPFETVVLGAVLPVLAVVFGVPGASGVTYGIGLHVWQNVIS